MNAEQKAKQLQNLEEDFQLRVFMRRAARVAMRLLTEAEARAEEQRRELRKKNIAFMKKGGVRRRNGKKK